MRKYLTLSLLILSALACNYLMPTPTPAPTPANLPQTEDAVPRISIQEAKKALDNGEAVVVDVRSAESFAQGHIAGAVNIPLIEFETDAAGANLDKNQWIITYCA